MIDIGQPYADLVVSVRGGVPAARLPSGVLFHSEQGGQYGSWVFRQCYRITQSMSRRDNSLDNTIMDRLFRCLKKELPSAM